MLVGLLTTLLVIDGLLLVLFILIQKGKGDMGLGAFGGGAQTLFGGSGGQDIFQKITWVLGAIFMAGSLGLSIIKSKGITFSDVVSKTSTRNLPISRPVEQDQQSSPVQQQAPVNPPASETQPK
jgi:preprotein translocase subunit SecG